MPEEMWEDFVGEEAFTAMLHEARTRYSNAQIAAGVDAEPEDLEWEAYNIECHGACDTSWGGIELWDAIRHNGYAILKPNIITTFDGKVEDELVRDYDIGIGGSKPGTHMAVEMEMEKLIAQGYNVSRDGCSHNLEIAALVIRAQRDGWDSTFVHEFELDGEDLQGDRADWNKYGYIVLRNPDWTVAEVDAELEKIGFSGYLEETRRAV